MIGSIMAVVAVLEIHMERIEVGTMNPNIRNLGEVPTILIAFKAIRRCRLHSSIAMASIRPGRKILLQLNIQKDGGGTMKHNIRNLGEVPTIRTAFKAIRRCRLHSSIIAELK